MAHAVIRTDLMAGTQDYGQLKSAMYVESNNNAEIDNGNIVVLDGLMSGQREVYKAVAPTATNKPSQLYITAGVVLFYDESIHHYEDEWTNNAGEPVRVYKLHDGDVFSVTADALAKVPAVGEYVGFAANSTKITSAATASATSFGKVIDIEVAGRYTYYVIEVCDVASAG